MPVKADPVEVKTRSTRQKVAILRALADIDEFRSAQEIHKLLGQKKFKVGLATVYRTLQKMAAQEEIDAIRGADGETIYRRCGQKEGHHHHLICRQCGITITVEGPIIENWTEKIAEQNGFIDVSHTVDIFGICRSCSREV